MSRTSLHICMITFTLVIDNAVGAIKYDEVLQHAHERGFDVTVIRDGPYQVAYVWWYSSVYCK